VIRHNIRMLVAFGIVTTIVAWIALMVSFWLPDPAGTALQATALAIGIPGLVFAVSGVIFETELVTEFEKREEKVKRTHPLRCSDCGTKILNAGGTTIGDELEEELMIEPGTWRPPRTSPYDHDKGGPMA